MATAPSKAALEQYIREAARARGIDPTTAVKVARSEGLNANPSDGWQSNYKKSGIREPSYGPFQLLVGGSGTGFPVGLGNEFMRQTGMDPRDPSTVYAQIDFALDNAAQNGWSAWYGAKNVGIDKWDGLRGAQPQGISAQPQTQIAQADIPTPTEAPRGLLTAYDEPAPTFAENMRNTWLDGLFSTPSAQADPLPPVPTSPGRTMVPDSFQGVPIMSGGHLPLVNAGAADPAPTLPISYDTMGVPDWAFQSSEFAKSPENHQALPAQHPIYDQLLARSAEYQQQPSSGLAGLFSTPSAAAADLPPQPAVPASVAANPESYLPGEMMLGDWASMPSMPGYAMAPAQAPVQPPVQPLAPPRQVAQRQVAEPPAPPPMPSAMDVWNNKAAFGVDTAGGTVVKNADGTTSRYSAEFDNWSTFNPETQQWLPGGGQTGNINLPSKDRLLSGGKNMAGSMAGGLLGSYLGGPIGGLLGAALGKSVAQGKGLQGIFGGDKTTVFPAAPGSGLTGPFPSAPRSPRGSGNSSSGSFGNSSYDDVYALSPDVADAIASGVGGLW